MIKQLLSIACLTAGGYWAYDAVGELDKQAEYIETTIAKQAPEESIESMVEVAKAKQIKAEPESRYSRKYVDHLEGTLGSAITMEVTGYTAGYESTQKTPDHPNYGEVAMSRSMVAEYKKVLVEPGVTVAAGESIPFGTKVYIPYFEERGLKGYEDGIFEVQDRGQAIGDNNIDVYFERVTDAREFGRQNLEVYILD